MSVYSQFQASDDTYRAAWDVSGDPCPATNYQWKIQRLDGRVMMDWLNMNCMSLLKLFSSIYISLR